MSTPEVVDVNTVAKGTVSSTAAPAASRVSTGTVMLFCGVVTVASLISTIVLSTQVNSDSSKSATPSTIEIIQAAPQITVNTGTSTFATARPPAGENPCADKKPDLPNVQCIVDAMTNIGPQAGANVTKGYQGELQVDHVPITTPYWQNAMCPVNVHWHLGAEHYSAGQYDENGLGPIDDASTLDLNRRELVTTNVRQGYRCSFFDEQDNKFTKPFVWEHCVGMSVGETYEVHWPHSAAGACGTVNQYQTPFYDGVFCTDGVLTNTAQQIGVQAQVFTIVNDENFYYPDLMRGMIVDGEFGQDMAMYTGSTTGTSRDNEVCSPFSPITWQVDRTCHMVSASSFDKMCADMKAQRDDMSSDLYAHGSRELVTDAFAANNHQRKNLRV